MLAVSLSAFDPSRTAAVHFCCDAQHTPLFDDVVATNDAGGLNKAEPTGQESVVRNLRGWETWNKRTIQHLRHLSQ
jgi:hypothetical protein